jgi:hypothetical protein
MAQTHNRERNDRYGNLIEFYDLNTDESTARFKPVTMDEDFVGPGHSAIPASGSPAAGYPWVSKTVHTSGSPTVAVVANQAGGVVACAIDSTSEKQDAAIYANDMLNWDMTKYLLYQSRIAMSVLPSAAAVEAVLGLQSAWIDGPDNVSFYCRFQMLANGLVNMQCKDGVTTRSASSGITLVAGAFHIFRIDATDPTNIRFFIDGVEKSTAGQFTFAATGASAILQPYCSVYKASGTGVGTMQIDMIQIGTDRLT